MKKIIALALAAVLLLFCSLRKAERRKRDDHAFRCLKGQAKSALEILEKVWSKYSTDENFLQQAVPKSI